MKKLFAIVATALTLAAPTLTQAHEGFYAGAQGGLNFLHVKDLHSRHVEFDTGYELGLVAGYGWCNGFRGEAEVAYRNNDYKLHARDEEGTKHHFKGDIHTWSFMANGYYDFCEWYCVTPYVGGGIGYDKLHQSIHAGGHKYKGSNSGFAWQLMAGVNYDLCEDWVVSGEYKFHMSPLKHSHNNLQNHAITIGVKKFFCCCF